jgi:hypothetical protein
MSLSPSTTRPCMPPRHIPQFGPPSRSAKSTPLRIGIGMPCHALPEARQGMARHADASEDSFAVASAAFDPKGGGVLQVAGAASFVAGGYLFFTN